MIKVNIIYPNKEGSHFDWDYYLNRHMPRAIEKLGSGVKGVSVEQGLGGTRPDAPAEYVALCHYTFESVDDFLNAFMPVGEELQADMRNYTNIEPIIQFSEVRMSQ